MGTLTLQDWIFLVLGGIVIVMAIQNIVQKHQAKKHLDSLMEMLKKDPTLGSRKQQ